MTHFVGLVVADSADEIAELLAPYDENWEVDEYFEALTPESLTRMADHYGIDPADLPALKAKVQDWVGHEAVLKKDGTLGYMTTYNPASKWDWYVIGGRWDGMVPGNRCQVSELKGHFVSDDGEEWTPAVLVDNEGWHADKEYGWFGTDRPSDTPGVVAERLKKHADRKVYVVDFHGA
jgi:hypothetical protein